MTKPLVVANRNAGGIEDAPVTELADRLGARILWTESPADLDEIRDDRHDLIVVVGGDGSLSALVQHLGIDRLSEVRLGLFPVGTGNDLATALDLRADIDQACALVESGAERQLDVIVSDQGRIAVNAVHLGIGAAAAESGEELKSMLGPVAFTVGALTSGFTFEAFDLEVRVDGTALSLPGPALMAAISNGPTIGGQTPLAPDALPDDGVIEVMVACSDAAIDRAGFAVAMSRGTHTERDDVVLAAGRLVEIESDPVRYNIDGEVTEAIVASTWRVVVGALRLVAPQPMRD